MSLSPIQISIILLVHVVEPGKLLVLEILHLEVDVRLSVQHQRLIEVAVSVKDFLVGGIAFEETCSSELLNHVYRGTSIDV